MRGCCNRAVMTLACLGLLGAICQAADLAQVEKEIMDKMKSTKSVRAQMTIKMDMANPNMSQTMDGNGRIEVMRDAGKLYQRSEQKIKQKMKIGDNEMENDLTQLTVSDGEWTYQLTDMGAMGKQCNKFRMPTEEPKPFEEMQKAYDIKVLPDEKVDGADCWVIECNPKGGAPDSPLSQGKMVMWYRKDSGFTVKMVAHDQEGKKVMETNFTDVKIGGDIPKDHFEWKAPEGVECQDVTEQMKAMMDAAAAGGQGEQNANTGNENSGG